MYKILWNTGKTVLRGQFKAVMPRVNKKDLKIVIYLSPE